MRIKITDHALISISERGIAQYEVEDTIRYPDSVEKQAHGPMIAVKQINKRMISVIYSDKGKEKIFITAWVNDVLE